MNAIEGNRPDTTSGQASMQPPTRDHLLLTVLGKDPKPAHYTLEDRQAEAQLAPVALLDLLPEDARPDRVLALCTPEAMQETWPLLEQELSDRRFPVEAVDVPSGDAQEDVNAFLVAVTGAIPEKTELSVDVTHGFRHFSFLIYIGVLYLAALRGVRVRGAYYGLLNQDSTGPFLDLRPLLELPRWIHALEVLRETGSALPMAETLLGRSDSESAKNVARDLAWFSEAYLAGLPIELGRQARGVREQYLKPLKKMLRREHRLPLADELVEQLAKMVEPFALTSSDSDDGWKRRVVLSKYELERQVGVIDDLLRRGNVATALGLMNEWTVSWVVWRLDGQSEWLNYPKVRRRAANLLGAVAAVGKDRQLRHILTNQQWQLGNFWKNLCDLRNAYHHHGMRPQVLVRNPQITEKLRCIQDFWEGTLRSCPDLSLTMGESVGGRILVSPIGKRPGVLFSALQACRTEGEEGEPTLCLVICSHETKELIAAATQNACYEGAVEPLLLEDAFGGKDEIKTLAKKARGHFVGATEVLVNVTGGTTLMGFVAESLANEARLLACPIVRRFGLIDRRPPREQENDPYQMGQPFWLDPKDNAE